MIFSRTWWKWFAMTIFIAIVFALLDAIFDTTIQVGFVELGFLAFVVIWCAKQDEVINHQESNHDNQ